MRGARTRPPQARFYDAEMARSSEDEEDEVVLPMEEEGGAQQAYQADVEMDSEEDEEEVGEWEQEEGEEGEEEEGGGSQRPEPSASQHQAPHVRVEDIGIGWALTFRTRVQKTKAVALKSAGEGGRCCTGKQEGTTHRALCRTPYSGAAA